jgi:preprotein translocase subunit SecG
MAEERTGYRGRWKKWLAIYAAAAIVIYLIVYFVFFHSSGGYGGGGSGGGGGGYWIVALPATMRAGWNRIRRRTRPQ